MDPEKRVQQHTVEQVRNVPAPHSREQIAEVVTVILQKNAFLGVCALRVFPKLGDKVSCPSCRARSARSLPLSPLEPAYHVELPAFQKCSIEPVSVELWRRY